MEKEKIIAFFNGLADSWDAGMVRNEKVIAAILDNAQIYAGTAVLDVACGTGVLIPDYLERQVQSVTGIDISDRMVEIAQRKFAEYENVEIICQDVYDLDEACLYDRIVVYNALPHFESPEQLVACLSRHLRKGGYLTIAHGMSRARINGHHSNVSSDVSRSLITSEELSQIFGQYLTVTTVIDNEDMYQVTGYKE